jgi:hypothetical protein
MPHIPLPQNQIKPNKASASDRDLISGAIRAVAFWIGKRLRIQMVILLELSETSDYIAAVDCVWTKAKTYIAIDEVLSLGNKLKC